MATSPFYTPNAPAASYSTPFAQAAAQGMVSRPGVVPMTGTKVAFNPGSRQPAVTTSVAAGRVSTQLAVQKSALAPFVDAGASQLPESMQARFKAEVGTPSTWTLAKSSGVIASEQLQASRAAAVANPQGMASQSEKKVDAGLVQTKAADDQLAKSERMAKDAAALANAAVAKDDPAMAYEALRQANVARSSALKTGAGLFTSAAKTAREAMNLGALKTLVANPNAHPTMVDGTKKLLDMKLSVPLPAAVDDNAQAFAEAAALRSMSNTQEPWVLGDIDTRSIAQQAITAAADVQKIRPAVKYQLDHVNMALARGADQAMRGQFRVAQASFGGLEDVPFKANAPYVLGRLGHFGDFWSDLTAAAEKAGAGALANLGKSSGAPVSAPLPPKAGSSGPSMLMIAGGVAGVAFLAVGTFFALKR